MEILQIKSNDDKKILPKGLSAIISSPYTEPIPLVLQNGIFNYFGKANLTLLKKIEDIGREIVAELTKVASLYDRKNSLTGTINKTQLSLESTVSNLLELKTDVFFAIERLVSSLTYKELDDSEKELNLKIENLSNLIKNKLLTEKSKNDLDYDFGTSSTEMSNIRQSLDKTTATLKKSIIEYFQLEHSLLIPLIEKHDLVIQQIVTFGEKALDINLSTIMSKSSPLISLIAKRYELFNKFVKILEKLIQEYLYKKIVKSDVINAKKVLNQIAVIDTHFTDELGIKVVYDSIPSNIGKSHKEALLYYSKYIDKLFNEDCPSIESKVFKSQNKDAFTNAVATAINSLSLLL